MLHAREKQTRRWAALSENVPNPSLAFLIRGATFRPDFVDVDTGNPLKQGKKLKTLRFK
jgi:hypothetical protein